MRLALLLDSLRPTRMIDPVRRVLDRALEDFPYRLSRITNWVEFRYWFVLLCRHCDAAVLDLKEMPSELNVDAEWGMYSRHLKRALGPSGDKAAMGMAMSGCDGGLIEVSRLIARAIGDEYIDNWIGASVWGYWNSLRVEEQSAASDEFVERCGHLYAEMAEGSEAWIRANLPQLLLQYPRMLEKLRDSVRVPAGT